MRPISLLSIYFAATFCGAALFAPWLYKFAQSATHLGEGFQHLAREPFHRYVNRSLLFLALIGLWPFLRGLRVRSWRDLGFAPFQLHWRRALDGVSVGFLSMTTLAATALLFGARRWDLPVTGSEVLAEVVGAILTALMVAVLEETLFRGALFGALRKAHSWQMASFTSSAIYALLHFFAKAAPPESVNWSSGFLTLASMLRGFFDMEMLVPGFFNLLIAGLILALAFQRTGNLYFSIGLHASWIFCVKFYGFLTKKVAGTDLGFWGNSKMFDGWLATLVLALLLGILLIRKPIENNWNKR